MSGGVRIHGLLAAAAALALALGACGDDDEDEERPAVPSPAAGGRFESPDVVFEASAKPPTRQVTAGGKRIEGDGRRLVVVRLRLTNRRASTLRVGQLAADFETREGRTYPPVIADGRDTTAPVFAEPVVRPRAAIVSTVVYRVPPDAIAGADLGVSDPVRRQRFELSLF